MLKEEMTVGPKGQVVIPSALRKALKIRPGSKVIIKLADNKVIIERHEIDSVGIFGKVARKGKSVKRISPHEYVSEIFERNEL
jgi:AbrB family looped-hinge helix DNA binding protein